MKKLQRTIPVICIFVILAIVTACIASAASETDTIIENNNAVYTVGDANGDGKLTISDATLIQKYIANVEDAELSEGALIRADANKNNEVDVNDATAIQNYCNGQKGETVTGTFADCPGHILINKTHTSDQINIGETTSYEETATRTVYKAEEHFQCPVCKEDITLLARKYNAENNTKLSVTDYIARIHSPLIPGTIKRSGCGQFQTDILMYYYEVEEPYVIKHIVDAEPKYTLTTYDECDICGYANIINQTVVDKDGNPVEEYNEPTGITTPTSDTEKESIKPFSKNVNSLNKGDTLVFYCRGITTSKVINGQFSLVYPSNTLKLKSIEFPKIKNYIGYNDKLDNELRFNFTDSESGYDFEDSNKAKLIIAKFEVLTDALAVNLSLKCEELNDFALTPITSVQLKGGAFVEEEGEAETTEPTTTEPAQSEPAQSEPTQSEPISTEPVVTEPIATEPTTEPAQPATQATVSKKQNPVKTIVKLKTITAKKLKKTKVTLNPLTVKNPKGTVKIVKVKSGTASKIYNRISVNKKNGAIKLKKGKYKKGVYKIKLKISVKGNSKYKAKTLSKVVKIKIK
ncbi:MAG: dockerin type I repeat-containing protein [Clostridia bacterium]|nr:dockerin type I repeat-containing protein [Clostridia bacterium]